MRPRYVIRPRIPKGGPIILRRSSSILVHMRLGHVCANLRVYVIRVTSSMTAGACLTMIGYYRLIDMTQVVAHWYGIAITVV